MNAKASFSARIFTPRIFRSNYYFYSEIPYILCFLNYDIFTEKKFKLFSIMIKLNEKNNNYLGILLHIEKLTKIKLIYND